MFLKALPEKAGFSLVPVPTGVYSPSFSGLLRAGLQNPSRIQCCKIFVLAQVLLDLWELSLK